MGGDGAVPQLDHPPLGAVLAAPPPGHGRRRPDAPVTAVSDRLHSSLGDDATRSRIQRPDGWHSKSLPLRRRLSSSVRGLPEMVVGSEGWMVATASQATFIR